jgi:hypothetical protein
MCRRRYEIATGTGFRARAPKCCGLGLDRDLTYRSVPVLASHGLKQECKVERRILPPLERTVNSRSGSGW